MRNSFRQIQYSVSNSLSTIPDGIISTIDLDFLKLLRNIYFAVFRTAVVVLIVYPLMDSRRQNLSLTRKQNNINTHGFYQQLDSLAGLLLVAHLLSEQL